ncbi:MAG: glutathione transferase GstA [Myxococcaceae bacterium]
MKLYYATGTCSLAPHIALAESGLPFSLVRFEMKTGQLEDGRAITHVNDKGYVPVLELDNGERLTEVGAILQWVADQKPELKLAPPGGTMERYRLQEWLNFIGMEVHKIYWPLFHHGAEVELQHAREKLNRSFAYVNARLGSGPYLMGQTFTVADAYLLTVLSWARAGGLDPLQWPHLSAFRTRMRERAGVRAAMQAEGLLK